MAKIRVLTARQCETLSAGFHSVIHNSFDKNIKQYKLSKGLKIRVSQVRFPLRESNKYFNLLYINNNLKLNIQCYTYSYT